MMGSLCFILTMFLLIYCINAKVKDRYSPRYHLRPPYGWMNDPNGFSYYKGYYHIFYQYNPYSSLEAGTAHWGHAKSTDLLHWEHLPIALTPDNTYDKNGVFSGSALIENDVMYLYYTAHVDHDGETPDQEEHQALAVSTDGVNFKKYENNPIIEGAEFQPDFRDPKVWKNGDTIYMVLGNSINDTYGRILLYSSTDKINWSFESVIDQSTEKLGYMWECPDLFELDGHFILLFSPQGVEADGDKYKNLYQAGYIVGDYNNKTKKFTPLTKFQELDHGHDFYATQTLLDKHLRRIVIAWFDMWETNYPEAADGFKGHLILPRTLTLRKDFRLIQKPVDEIKTARSNMIRTGSASNGTTVTLDDKAGEVHIKASFSNDLELYIESNIVSVKILYEAKNGRISLNRGGDDGLRRTEWRPTGVLILNIYIDASSIEVFCGDGEVTFSSRFFPNGAISVRLGDTSAVNQFRVFNLKRTVNNDSIPKQNKLIHFVKNMLSKIPFIN